MHISIIVKPQNQMITQYCRKQFLFSPSLAGSAQGADEVVGLLVKAGMYDRAVILTRAFGLKLNPVFESLALR